MKLAKSVPQACHSLAGASGQRSRDLLAGLGHALLLCLGLLQKVSILWHLHCLVHQAVGQRPVSRCPFQVASAQTGQELFYLGFVVESTGLYFLMSSMSPVSATTLLISFRACSWFSDSCVPACCGDLTSVASNFVAAAARVTQSFPAGR